MIDASRTVLIAYSMPIWGMLLSIFILGERPSRTMVLGVATGFAGLVLLCAPWAMDWRSQTALFGSLLAFLGTIAWALASVLYRRRPWTSNFWSQIFGQFAAASVVLVPLAVLIEDKPPTFTSSFVLITIWSAVVPTTIGFYCWARAIDRVPVAKASQILLLAPIVGMLLSAGVLGERLSPALLSSAALILVGAALSYLPAPSGAKST
jgi:drug/metabolite transporter (DMT)-like permease